MKFPLYAYLEGKKVIPSESASDPRFIKLFEQGNRVVGNSVFKIRGKEVEVSTVFLGINHGDIKPLWFETMVFGGRYDGDTWRYETWGEAQIGHIEAVGKVKSFSALFPKWWPW